MTSRASTAPAAAVGRSPDTRGRILDAARRRFLEAGYAGTSISSIVRELEISAPAVYWHFESKEEILFELIRERLQFFVERVTTDASEPVRRLEELVHAWVLVQLDESRDARAYAHLLSIAQSGQVLTDEHAAEIDAMQHRMYSRMRDAVEAGAAQGCFAVADSRSAAFSIIAMCEHVNGWARPSGPLTSSEIADHVVDYAIRLVGHGQT